MAELFLARQVGMEGFERIVAIKRILAHLAHDEDFINMFRDEARIVAKLSHPNIVQIYDLGKSNDTYFIAMEYIPGRNLASVAKKIRKVGAKLKPEYFARCVAEACAGLHYAHTRQDLDGKPLGIVHRDVSPQNVIVAFSGGVKLVDFGIAKAATKIAHTRAGVLKGKYAYMSPEQIRGEEIDARSDLFAVGIVLYELLCGKRPFEKENSIQTLKAIVQEKPGDCRELNPEIPKALADIIDRCLAKRRDERFQSAQEVQMALEDYLVGSKTRVHNVVISEWLQELFKEELAKGGPGGSMMVLKGLGEVILPDADDQKARSEERPEDVPGQTQEAPVASSIDEPAPKPRILSRQPTRRSRPGITSSDISSSGRASLIKEGVIDRPFDDAQDRIDDGATRSTSALDDKTAFTPNPNAEEGTEPAVREEEKAPAPSFIEDETLLAIDSGRPADPWGEKTSADPSGSQPVAPAPIAARMGGSLSEREPGSTSQVFERDNPWDDQTVADPAQEGTSESSTLSPSSTPIVDHIETYERSSDAEERTDERSAEDPIPEPAYDAEVNFDEHKTLGLSALELAAQEALAAAEAAEEAEKADAEDAFLADDTHFEGLNPGGEFTDSTDEAPSSSLDASSILPLEISGVFPVQRATSYDDGATQQAPKQSVTPPEPEKERVAAIRLERVSAVPAGGVREVDRKLDADTPHEIEAAEIEFEEGASGEQPVTSKEEEVLEDPGPPTHDDLAATLQSAEQIGSPLGSPSDLFKEVEKPLTKDPSFGQIGSTKVPPANVSLSELLMDQDRAVYPSPKNLSFDRPLGASNPELSLEQFSERANVMTGRTNVRVIKETVRSQHAPPEAKRPPEFSPPASPAPVSVPPTNPLLGGVGLPGAYGLPMPPVPQKRSLGDRLKIGLVILLFAALLALIGYLGAYIVGQLMP